MDETRQSDAARQVDEIELVDATENENSTGEVNVTKEVDIGLGLDAAGDAAEEVNITREITGEGENLLREMKIAVRARARARARARSREFIGLQGQDQDDSDHSDEEESGINFQSEHSGNTSNSVSFTNSASNLIDPDEDSINEVTAEDFMIDKLYEQLQEGFHDCSNEQHQEALLAHMNDDVGENHYGLDILFNDAQFPSVLGLQEMLSSERLARQQLPTPSQWKAMFCGIPLDGRQRSPINMCMHEEQTQAVEPDIAFDIDSFLGFANSLAIARKGLWYQPAPQMQQNMTSDVHLNTHLFQVSNNPEQPEQAKVAMLRDVPHFLLGRVEGAQNVAMFVLFPHLGIAGDKFKSLTEDQLSRWADKVYMPGLHKFYQGHYMQHIPASHRNAYENSKAYQVEGRQSQTSSYRSKQSIGYHLQPQHLHQIWQDILETIDSTPGLADF